MEISAQYDQLVTAADKAKLAQQRESFDGRGEGKGRMVATGGGSEGSEAAVAAAVDGRFMAAFVRATKPTGAAVGQKAGAAA